MFINLRRLHAVTRRLSSDSPFAPPAVAIMDTKDSIPIRPSDLKDLLADWKMVSPVLGPYELPVGDKPEEQWWFSSESVLLIEPTGFDGKVKTVNVWTTAGMIVLPSQSPWTI